MTAFSSLSDSNSFMHKESIIWTCGRSVSLFGRRLSTSRSMFRIFCSGPCGRRGNRVSVCVCPCVCVRVCVCVCV